MSSGDTLVALVAQDSAPPASNYATPDVRNSHPVLCFDDTLVESADFQAFLPRFYGGGGITVTFIWMAATATSGNVMWQAALERLNAANHDLDSDNFATTQSAAASACDATSGKLTYTTLAITSGANMDSIAAGDEFRIRITRNGASGSDTMSGDAHLIGIEIKET